MFPSGPEYYDRLYGPRRWTSAVSLNLAIGQGENSQTLLDMVRLYQMLASDGKSRPPYLVRPAPQPTYDLELTPEQLAGLRQAMINVVERGTGRVARLAELQIAGKTGTAQNSQGADHGWFIGFAPADNPQIVVGSVIEVARHGTALAPHGGARDRPLPRRRHHRRPVPVPPAQRYRPARHPPDGSAADRFSHRQHTCSSDSVSSIARCLGVVTALAVYGLLILYSAGRTDVATVVSTIWLRQLAWLALGITCASSSSGFRRGSWSGPHRTCTGRPCSCCC